MGYKEFNTRMTVDAGQAVTADANSTNYVDFEVTTPSDFDGRPVAYVVTVMAKTTAGTGIQFKACQKATEPTEDDADIADWTYLAAELTKGKEIVLPLPSGKTWLRYHRLYFEIIGGSESYTLYVNGPTPDPRC